MSTVTLCDSPLSNVHSTSIQTTRSTTIYLQLNLTAIFCLLCSFHNNSMWQKLKRTQKKKRKNAIRRIHCYLSPGICRHMFESFTFHLSMCCRAHLVKISATRSYEKRNFSSFFYIYILQKSFAQPDIIEIFIVLPSKIRWVHFQWHHHSCHDLIHCNRTAPLLLLSWFIATIYELFGFAYILFSYTYIWYNRLHLCQVKNVWWHVFFHSVLSDMSLNVKKKISIQKLWKSFQFTICAHFITNINLNLNLDWIAIQIHCNSYFRRLKTHHTLTYEMSSSEISFEDVKKYELEQE